MIYKGKCLGIVGKVISQELGARSVKIHSIPILDDDMHFAIIEAPVSFDPNEPANKNSVLIRKKTFSCNYREKSLLVSSQKNLNSREGTFSAFGSEFAGEILAVGCGVSDFKQGDRVIGNGNYDLSLSNNSPSGLPTNHASKELETMPSSKVIKIPDSMSYEIGAAFSVGAQTSYSMIRRMELKKGKNILVTSASSNTSLFILNGLKNSGCNIYVSTTSNRVDKLKKLGANHVVNIDTRRPFTDSFKSLISDINGFDYVFDPFMDTHLSDVISLMGFNGKYISCGIYDQFSDGNRGNISISSLCRIITHNQSIIGNCLGTSDDLIRALQDFDKGNLDVVIDSIHCSDSIEEFISRSFGFEKFGKVVFKF